jgi:hypothetical protein
LLQGIYALTGASGTTEVWTVFVLGVTGIKADAAEAKADEIEEAEAEADESGGGVGESVSILAFLVAIGLG